MSHPEIQKLKELYQKHKIGISVSDKEFMGGKKDFPAVLFSLNDKTFPLFVDDEFEDFKLNNPLLNLCLVLRELEYYKDTYDYLLWCKELSQDASDIVVLNYYRSLASIYREVENILGEINCPITDYEFEFNTTGGPLQKLRETD